MNKKQLGLLVTLILIGGIIYLIGSEKIDIPFAAIPVSDSQHWLSDTTVGHSRTLSIKFENGNKPFNKLYYKVVVYGPNANFNGAPETIVKDWTLHGSLGAYSQVTWNVPLPASIINTEGEYYAILVYVKDGNDLTGCNDPDDYSSCIYKDISRSAFDVQYVSSCKASPIKFGCTTSNKNICCSGSGYWMNVVPEDITEYSGSIRVN